MEIAGQLEHLKLKPGDVLVLRPNVLVSLAAMNSLREAAQSVNDTLGISIIVLDPELDVVAVQESAG